MAVVVHVVYATARQTLFFTAGGKVQELGNIGYLIGSIPELGLEDSRGAAVPHVDQVSARPPSAWLTGLINTNQRAHPP